MALGAHLVLDAQRHLQDLLREEQEVEAAEDPDGIQHIVVHLGVEAQSLWGGERSVKGPRGRFDYIFLIK